MAEAPLITIVDDDPWAREGIKELILSLGYRASAFASAQQFIDSGCAEGAACLITDLHMPRINGLDLQHLLRTNGCRIPVIFITAYPDEKYRARAIREGAACFLSKPFTESSLIACLQQAVRDRPQAKLGPS